MDMRIDVFIPFHEKDILLLGYCVNAIKKQAWVGDIFICGKTNPNIKGVIFIDEESIIPFSEVTCNYRPRWIYQQLLKLYQKVTNGRYYFVVDSDTIIRGNLEIFKNDKPILYEASTPQFHKPYFELLSIFGIKRLHNKSYINDFMVFDRDLINLPHYSEILKVTTSNCYISEYEWMGNIYAKTIPTTKIIKKQYGKEVGKEVWSKKTIEQVLSTSIYKIITFHSWN